VDKISVIIPNYNGSKLLPACLSSLMRQTRPADEIIVVDDASGDDSVALVRARYPQVVLVQLRVNRGFCNAANTGLRTAKGGLLALLNNDAEPDPVWLAALSETLVAFPEVGFCASKVVFSKCRKRVNSAGLFMRVDGVGRDIGYGGRDGPSFETPRKVFGASGGAAMYRRQMLDDIGLFDQSFIAYGEDLDLSFRAQLRGYQCLYVPGAVVYHLGHASYGRSSQMAVYLGCRNMLTTVLKNMPGRLLYRHWLRILAAQIYQIGYFSLRGNGLAAIRGKLSVISHLHEITAKRGAIMKARRVSDNYLESLLFRGLQGSIRFSLRND
jgi:GT2 family glycosyltransferase